VAGETDRAEHTVASLTSVARQSGSVPHMGKIARAAARIRAERGHAHSARLLSQESVRLHEQNGHRGQAFGAVLDQAGIELHFHRPDLARATLGRARPESAWQVFWLALLLLECDLHEAFASVSE